MATVPCPTLWLRSSGADMPDDVFSAMRSPSYIARRSSAIERLARALVASQPAAGLSHAAARALYGSTDAEMSQSASSYFNQAVTPLSALHVSHSIRALQPRSLYYAGCGHGQEMLTTALHLSLARHPCSITAIDNDFIYDNILLRYY